MPKKSKVGVYVDVDNFMIPLNKQQERVKKGLQFILEKSEKEGKIIELKAYANYTDQPEWLSKMLCSYGCSMIFTPALNGNGKNIDDQEMAKDITLVQFGRPEINTIIVVSADGHFISAISSIRRSGRKVVVICTGAPSSILKEAADEIIVVELNDQDSNSRLNEINEETILSDIKNLIKQRGLAFDRRSLLEALKNGNARDNERLDYILDLLIRKGTVKFTMEPHNGQTLPAIHINN